MTATPPTDAELALMLTRWPRVVAVSPRNQEYLDVHPTERDKVETIHRLVAEVRRLGLALSESMVSVVVLRDAYQEAHAQAQGARAEVRRLGKDASRLSYHHSLRGLPHPDVPEDFRLPNGTTVVIDPCRACREHDALDRLPASRLT